MTRIVLSAFATVLLASPLSQHDRDLGVGQMRTSRKMFIDALAQVSTAQWNFKPAPDRWSVGEIAEHIALSEDMIFSLITGEIVKNPADPAKRAAPPVTDAYVHERDLDRSHKAKAPDYLVPTHRWKDKDELSAAFLKSRDRSIAYLQATREDLRVHFQPSPIGTLDAFQWFLFMSSHTERHLKQMEEVKLDPNYPKQ
jgi:uncharacterized damage-inducible protein DinB